MSNTNWHEKLTTWRKELAVALQNQGETFNDIVAITLSEEDLDRVFYNDFGGEDGKPFTVWTTNRVYFPTIYDGLQSVASVSRNPDRMPTRHIGSNN